MACGDRTFTAPDVSWNCTRVHPSSCWTAPVSLFAFRGMQAACAKATAKRCIGGGRLCEPPRAGRQFVRLHGQRKRIPRDQRSRPRGGRPIWDKRQGPSITPAEGFSNPAAGNELQQGDGDVPGARCAAGANAGGSSLISAEAVTTDVLMNWHDGLA
jgi:hypothetical protein